MEWLAPKVTISALFLGLWAPARPKHQAIAMETIACSYMCIEKHSVLRAWVGEATFSVLLILVSDL